MKIAICDDDIKDIECLRKNILAHSSEHEIIEFFSAEKFLKRIYDGEYFDLLFLDVQMPDADGWEIAKELKQAKFKLFIAMVTVYGEYIFDCFDRVDWFAPKPVTQALVHKILDNATERLFPMVFKFQMDKFEIALTAPEIIYFEIRRNTLFVHSTKGCHEVRLALKKVKEMLQGYRQFVQIHSSFIINLDYYDSIKTTYVILKNEEKIKLSRTYRNVFYDSLSKYVKGS